MSTPEDEQETAREDLLVIVAFFVGAMITAGFLGAVVWNLLDKLFALLAVSGIWGAVGIIIYAVKSRLW